MEYTTNAPKGAALYDELRPGWASEIDRAALNIRSLKHCIVGQLEGDFDAGLSNLAGDWFGDAHGFGIEHGFAPPFGASAEQWDRLEAEWHALINERLAANAAAIADAVTTHMTPTV